MSIRNELLEQILTATAGASAMPEAPTDGTYTAKGATWTKLQDSVASPYFTWSSETVTPPGPGEMSASDSDLALATELRVSVSTSSLVDVGFVLRKLTPGNCVFATQVESETAYGGFNVVGLPVDNTTYITIPIAPGSIGTTPSNGESVAFDVYEFKSGEVSTYSTITGDATETLIASFTVGAGEQYTLLADFKCARDDGTQFYRQQMNVLAENSLGGGVLVDFDNFSVENVNSNQQIIGRVRTNGNDVEFTVTGKLSENYAWALAVTKDFF